MSAFAPQVGIIGVWYLLTATITGQVECTETEECGAAKTNFRDLNLPLSKTVGIGIGVTTLPRVHYAKRGTQVIQTLNDIIAFYRNQWTQFAKQILESPMTWCYLLGGFE